MDIIQLRTLVCVAEHGSLSKAADHLCTAQPSLSRHVRSLEDELKTRLFDRHGRGMILTEQGRVVLRYAIQLLKQFDEIKTTIYDDENATSSHVSIGMPPTVSEILAVPLITELRATRPNATFRIISGFSHYLLKWVHDGDLDVAILYDPHAVRSLKAEPLAEEEFYLVGDSHRRLALHECVEFESLQAEQMILPSRDHSLRQIADRAAHESGVLLNVKTEADSYSTLKQLVMAGQGLTILPLAAVQADIDANRLTAARLIAPISKRRLEVAVSTDRPLSRLGSLVRDTIFSTAKLLGESGQWPGYARPK